MFTDFNKLNTFLEVAKTGSISKAADNLFRTQSAITQQIQSLEEELEITLFDRKNARIYLTPEGEQIYEHAITRLREVTENLMSIKGDMASISGRIRVGVRPDFGHYLMPILIANFKEKFPKVNFSVFHGNAIDVENMLIANKIDIGILLLINDKKLFDITPIQKKNNVFVGTPELISKNKPIKNAKDILELDLIDYTEDNDATAFWMAKVDKTLVTKTRKKRASVVCDDSAVAKEMILRGLGIGIMPKFMIEPELKDGTLIEILPKLKVDFWTSFDIAVKKKRSKNLVKDEFLSFCIEEIGEK